MKKLSNISWPFLLFHLIPVIGLFFIPLNLKWLSIMMGTYVFKHFFLTAGFHRYFSHKSFRLNRFWQFVFAFLGGTNGQKDALWWAAGHRYHHKHSDTPQDIHSPHHQGIRSHGLWVFFKEHTELKTSFIPDLIKYPELVWLHRHPFLPVMLWASLMYGLWGWGGVLYGCMISSLINWHATFTVNSLSHMIGEQDFESHDNSRNHWLIALITMGEGWHNNHHAYSKSANNGFYWWQIDLTYYGLKILSWIGVVSDLQKPPLDTLPRKIKPGVNSYEAK